MPTSSGPDTTRIWLELVSWFIFVIFNMGLVGSLISKLSDADVNLTPTRFRKFKKLAPKQKRYKMRKRAASDAKAIKGTGADAV